MGWRSLFNDSQLTGALEYVDSGAVTDLKIEGNSLSADVNGVDVFRVKISVAEGDVTDATCSCPLAVGGSRCKHIAAVLLAWEQMAESYGNNEKTATSSEEKMAGISDAAPGEQLTFIIPENDPTPMPEIAPPTLFDEEKTLDEVIEDSQSVSNMDFEPCFDNSVELQADINTFFSYALQQNRVAIVRSVTVKIHLILI